jgi:hypothetical protein
VIQRRKDDALPWPTDETGQKERGIKLVYAQNPTDVEVKRSLLAAYGIPSIADLPNQGFFSGAVFGAPLLGASLYVPASRLAEAEALLAAEVADDGQGTDDCERPETDL